jgi:hypothetical protein
MPASFSKASAGPDSLPSVSAPVYVRRPPAPLLVRLAAVAVAAPLMVRAGLPRLQRWLEPPSSSTRLSPADTDQLSGQYGKWVDSIITRGQPVVRPGCLTRGVSLYYALRREGMDVALCFGVGPQDGAIAGHCWLEWQGHPLLERADPLSSFTEVVRVSRAGVRTRDGSSV